MQSLLLPTNRRQITPLAEKNGTIELNLHRHHHPIIIMQEGEVPESVQLTIFCKNQRYKSVDTFGAESKQWYREVLVDRNSVERLNYLIKLICTVRAGSTEDVFLF